MAGYLHMQREFGPIKFQLEEQWKKSKSMATTFVANAFSQPEVNVTVGPGQLNVRLRYNHSLRTVCIALWEQRTGTEEIGAFQEAVQALAADPESPIFVPVS
jgi:hypothetical protein